MQYELVAMHVDSSGGRNRNSSVARWEPTGQDVVHFNEDAAEGQQPTHERNHRRSQVPLQQSHASCVILALLMDVRCALKW